MSIAHITKVSAGLVLSMATVLAWQNYAIAQEPAPQEPAKEATTKKKESAALKAIAASKAIYVGAEKCKSCHNKESKGQVYDKWTKMKHSVALKTLSGKEALAIGKERGIEKPAESPKCVKCHTTAYGVPKEKLHRRFPKDQGVQCETCHGPGSDHVKARLAAAKEQKVAEDVILEVTPGEIVLPDELLCRSCHNEESPSFQKFDFGERLEKIRHLNPHRDKPRVVPPKKKADEKKEG